MKRNLQYFINQFLSTTPPHRALIRAKEAELFQSVELKHPILDIGCGDGSFADIAFETTIDIGVDILEPDLKEAAKRGCYKKVVKASAVDLPFKDNTFNTIVSNCVLEHIEDLNGALQEIQRVLTPKGTLYCTVVGEHFNIWLLGTTVLGKKYTDLFNSISHHYHIYALQGWKDIFLENGLETVNEYEYIDKRTLRVFDILHSISVPTLLTKAFLGRWAIFPFVHRMLFGSMFFNILKTKKGEGVYYFLAVQKKI